MRRAKTAIPREFNLTRRWVAPAGSNRSGGGGNESVEASDGTSHLWVTQRSGRPKREVNTEQASRHQDARADLALFQGRPPSTGEEATDAPSDLAGVVVSACLYEGIDRNTGSPCGESA